MPARAASGRFASNADRSTSKNESTPAMPAIHRIANNRVLNFIVGESKSTSRFISGHAKPFGKHEAMPIRRADDELSRAVSSVGGFGEDFGEHSSSSRRGGRSVE